MSNESEHTFVETENVRYLYQPLESLYMLIITNKSSNIVEDLDTLHLMAKLVRKLSFSFLSILIIDTNRYFIFQVPIYCLSLEEKFIQKYAFELVFALDEVISAGHKEKVSVSRIKVLTDMDSHEEKIHEIVERVSIPNSFFYYFTFLLMIYKESTT